MTFVVNGGTKHDVPASYGAATIAKARKYPFPVSGDTSGTVKLTLGILGSKNYENTAVMKYTFTATSGKMFFIGYTTKWLADNAEGKGFGKLDSALSSGGYMAFSTITWGGYCNDAKTATACAAKVAHVF